jgi:hypothetical protein
MTDTSLIATEILNIVDEWELKLTALQEDATSKSKNNQNRSVKMILGHLVDSASNNTHRVIHLQYQSSPLTFPNYATFGNNDRWIAIQNYQNENWSDLVQLWKYSLLHFCHLIRNLDHSKLENEWISGQDERITLKRMIVDFPKHLNLHMSEINDLICSTT